ncbi:MAG: YCF48-related protein [Candidatus Eisenbacteria bacterium]
MSTPGDISLLSDFSTVRSTNNGVSWTTTTVPNELVYQSTTLVYSPQHRIISVRVEGAVLLETFDDGANWEVILADFDSGGFGDLTRLSDGTLLAVTDDGDLWRSTDQGVNWSNATRSPDDEPRVTISALAADANGRVFAELSQPGQSYRRFLSTDGGDSFGKVPEPAINFMNALAYTPGNLLLAGGSGATASRVWRSTDGPPAGRSMSYRTASAMASVFDFATPSAGEYFAAGYGNTGSASSGADSGVTWAQRTTGIPTNTFLTSVDFVNDQLGFAAGGSTNSARIWKTTNAGASWTSVGTTGIGDFIFGLHWFDAQNGLASTASAHQVTGIFRATNGGAAGLRSRIRRRGTSPSGTRRAATAR